MVQDILLFELPYYDAIRFAVIDPILGHSKAPHEHLERSRNDIKKAASTYSGEN